VYYVSRKKFEGLSYSKKKETSEEKSLENPSGMAKFLLRAKGLEFDVPFVGQMILPVVGVARRPRVGLKSKYNST